MTKDIHPQAVVHKDAKIEDEVKIGPGAVVDQYVTIKKGTKVGPCSYITGHTTIGENCTIFSHAVVGSAPQDLKYDGAKSFLTIGDNNVIREFVTINPGTEENSVTKIGSNNLIMAYSHIAHDCVVGNSNVFANAATLAGHVEVGDKVVVGGLVAMHQFCRIGNFAMIGGCSKVIQDIPPYSLCDGHPAKVYGVNLIGLRRAGFAKEEISNLKKSFKILFFNKHSLNVGLKNLEEEKIISQQVDNLRSFITSSQRGIVKSKKESAE